MRLPEQTRKATNRLEIYREEATQDQNWGLSGGGGLIGFSTDPSQLTTQLELDRIEDLTVARVRRATRPNVHSAHLPQPEGREQWSHCEARRDDRDDVRETRARWRASRGEGEGIGGSQPHSPGPFM